MTTRVKSIPKWILIVSGFFALMELGVGLLFRDFAGNIWSVGTQLKN